MANASNVDELSNVQIGDYGVTVDVGQILTAGVTAYDNQIVKSNMILPLVLFGGILLLANS